MPTSPIITYSGDYLQPLKNADAARSEEIVLAEGTYALGTIVGEVGTSGVYGAYAHTNEDGTQHPTHLLQYACTVDSSGNVTLGDVNEWGATRLAAPAYRCGYFSCADLPNLDSYAVAALGRLTQGDSTSGRLMVYGL